MTNRRLKLPILLLFGILFVMPFTGCKLSSEFAYRVGSFLDPDQVRCIDHVGSCSLCGDPPVAGQEIGGPITPVNYECPHCGNAGGMHESFLGEFEQFRAQASEFREELDAVNEQLAQRGQSLLQTRAELARVKNEVKTVRTEVAQWQTSVKDLHVKLKQRDAARMATLHELSDSVEQMMRSR